MAEYHVGCGLAGIYAGTHKKDGEWRNKSEVTHETLCATAQYLLFGGLEFHFKYKNNNYVLKVIENNEGD